MTATLPRAPVIRRSVTGTVVVTFPTKPERSTFVVSNLVCFDGSMSAMSPVEHLRSAFFAMTDLGASNVVPSNVMPRASVDSMISDGGGWPAGTGEGANLTPMALEVDSETYGYVMVWPSSMQSLHEKTRPSSLTYCHGLRSFM